MLSGLFFVPKRKTVEKPSPWGSVKCQTARQLSEYEIAEICAARVTVCRMGWIDGTEPCPTNEELEAAWKQWKA